MFRNLILLLLLFSLGGCTHFKETHYFKDEAGSPDNYYRLTVKGHTFMVSARYLSGYFDEKAVNQYFSEFAQPKDGLFEASPVDTTSEQGVESLTGSRKGQKLVLILSSNSDAVASQIGSFTENQNTLAALVRLVNRERILDASQASSDLTVQQTSGKILAELGDQLITNLTDESTQSEIAAALLQYVNAIAAELGNDRPFSSFENANTWLNNNRGRLINE